MQIAETLEKEGCVCTQRLADCMLIDCARRIPYVRFDGKMSAKRRQETIAQFSVPLEDKATPDTVDQPPAASQAGSSRPKRTRKTRSTTTVVDGDDEIQIIENGQDDDFVMDDEVDDDDFIDDEDDELASKRKKKGSKGKGKAVPKAAASGYKTPAFTGPNPKVMLISLKAGALGLNLTVANNVYLYVNPTPFSSHLSSLFPEWIREY